MIFITLINTDMRYDSHRLFLYETIIELVISSDGVLLENRPMNLKKLQAHKGLTNEIFFIVRDRDRKMQNVFSQRLMAYIMDPISKRRVLSKLIEPTSEIGRVKLTLLPAELEGLHSGTYVMNVTRSTTNVGDTHTRVVAWDSVTHNQYVLPEELNQLALGSYSMDVTRTILGTTDVYPVYSDQDNNIRFDIEITDQLGLEPVPTQSTNRFMQTANVTLGDNTNIYVCDPLQGNQSYNFVNAQHTIAVYTDTYTGNIEVHATCMPNAPSDNGKEWFVVTKIPLANVSGVTPYTFQVNANWIRIAHTPDDANSVITQVLLRN